MAHEEGFAPCKTCQRECQESGHREGFIGLNRMTQNAVSEITGPRDGGGCAIGLVVHAREEAAPAPHGDACCKA